MASLLSASITGSPCASTLYLAIAVALLVYLILSKKRRINSCGGVRLPPGPLGLPVLGSLPFVSFDLHTYFARLAQTYGPVFSLRLGSKLCVVLSSPSAAREALKDHDTVFANHDRTVAGLMITYGGNDLVFMPYGPLWRTLRRVCVSELLSSSSIEALRELRRREVRRMVAALRLKAGSAVEVREVAFATSLGVMRNMLWGEDGGAGAAEFREMVDGVLELIELPNVSDFFPAIARWDIQGVGRRMKGFSERFDRVFDAVIERRMKDGGPSGSKDFLQVLLDLLKRNDSEPELTTVHVKGVLFDMVSAGTETISTTVEWTMSELLENPDELKKAQEELDAMVGKDRVVEESDTAHLPFLNMVVKEVLRLHPPAPLLVPRHPSESCSIHGYMIPKEAKVFINVWAIQRDLANWDEPLSFKPERFMNATEKYDSKGSNFSYLPFGSGRRVCAGYHLGERMVMYVLATLLHSFDWKLPEGTSLNLNERFGVTMKKKEPLVAVPTVRLDNSVLYV